MLKWIPIPTAAVGFVATLALITVATRPAKAAKLEDCMSQNPALCQVIERCSGGFEANGTCKWIYTVSRKYWKN